MALAGDGAALRLCLDRLLPPIRGKDEPVVLAAMTGTLADQGGAILQAMAAGQVTPSEASTMMAALATQARIIEVDELIERIEVL